MKMMPRLLTTLFITALMPVPEVQPTAVAADYTTTTTYDDLGRPLSVTVGGSTTNFAYDAVGNRIVVSRSSGYAAPSVVVVAPPDGGTEVSPQATIAATFSRTINPATVTAGPTGTFQLTGPGNILVSGVAGVHGLEALFTPNAPLLNNTSYTATVTTGVMDLDGSALSRRKVWSFTTGAAPDLTPPTVLSTTPAPGVTNVPVTSTVTALFSEALAPATVTQGSFLLMDGAYAVAAAVTYTEATRTAVLLPDLPLDPGVSYTAVLLSAITDLSGNRMAGNKEWTFTTAAIGPPIPPEPATLIPYDGETGLPPLTSVGVIFTKAMNQNSINGSTFKLMNGNLAVPGTVSYNPIKHQATFIPAAALANEAVYTAMLTTDIKDTTGIQLPSPVNWSFSTAPLPLLLITCSLTGAGAGVIDSTPANLVCGTTGCSAAFPRNSTVLLSPAPYETSIFAGWSAPCAAGTDECAMPPSPCTGTGECMILLNAATALNATFDLKPVKIAGAPPRYFISLRAACDADAGDKTIQSRAITFTENLNCNQAGKIIFKGGYDPGYAGRTGYTTLNGILTIGQGRVTVERLIVR